MGSFIIITLWFLVVGIALAAGVIIAEAVDHVPRPVGPFFRFIAAMMVWREHQAQIVIDRFSPIDRHRNEARAPQVQDRKRSGQSGIRYFRA